MNHYEWVKDAPFLSLTVTEAGYDLPTSVMKEIWRFTALMNEGFDYEGNPDSNLNQIAAAYENSTITIGFSEAEQKELKEYHSAETWPNVQGGTPVAQWYSGMSTSCDMYLYLMPNGTFEWTEP